MGTQGLGISKRLKFQMNDWTPTTSSLTTTCDALLIHAEPTPAVASRAELWPPVQAASQQNRWRQQQLIDLRDALEHRAQAMATTRPPQPPLSQQSPRSPVNDLGMAYHGGGSTQQPGAPTMHFPPGDLMTPTCSIEVPTSPCERWLTSRSRIVITYRVLCSRPV